MIDISEFCEKIQRNNDSLSENPDIPFNKVMALWGLTPNELNLIDFSGDFIFGAHLDSANFSNSVFTNSRLAVCVFDGCLFDNIKFESTQLKNVLFINCSFKGSSFFRANFKNVFFIECETLTTRFLKINHAKTSEEPIFIDSIKSIGDRGDLALLIQRMGAIKEGLEQHYKGLLKLKTRTTWNVKFEKLGTDQAKEVNSISLDVDDEKLKHAFEVLSEAIGFEKFHED